MSTRISRTDAQRLWAQQFPVHVGVDAGKIHHALVARGPDGVRTKPCRVPISRTGFEAALAHLQELFPGISPKHVLVGIEFAGHHGLTFAAFLHGRGYRVVSVLAMATKATKRVEQVSANKTDAVDARQICRLVGDGLFVRFPFPDPVVAALKQLTMQRHRLTVEATRLKNRLQGLLDVVWPEFAGQFSAIDKASPRALLERWPAPQDLLRASSRTVRAFVQDVSRGHVGPERVQALLRSARETVGVTDALEERQLEIRHLLARWRLLDLELGELRTRIELLVPQSPEAQLLTTVPEVSAVCAATLVAELGCPGDFTHYRQILKLAGLNLDDRQSGLMQGRRRVSKHGRPMLRRQLYLLAGRWSLERGLYHEDYRRLRGHGMSGTKAIVTLARRLVPVLFAVMQRGEPFDEARWRGNRRAPARPTGAAGHDA